MKSFVIFALTLATVSGFDLRKAELNKGNVAVVESEGRITNGFEAHVGEFPYLVGLNLTLADNTFGWCSGSIISPTYVLTSAKCLEFTKSLVIYFGSIKRTSPEKTVTVDFYNGFILHDDYNMETLENNIGLIFCPPITYTNTIKAIPLPPYKPTVVGVYAAVPGWGRTVENGSLVEDLQFTYSTVISNDECAKSMENVFDTNICLFTEDGSSPCQGDSGSPLATVVDTYIMGVFSFTSTQGCTKNYPAVFERVTSHMSWIREITGIEES